MERISVKDLERQIERLNKIAGPEYELDNAYGKYRLWKGGGGGAPLNCGYITKRDLYNRLSAFISGLERGIEIAKNSL